MSANFFLAEGHRVFTVVRNARSDWIVANVAKPTVIACTAARNSHQSGRDAAPRARRQIEAVWNGLCCRL